MKSILFLSIAIMLTFNVFAQQPKQTNYDKTIKVIIKDYSEDCGEDPGDAIFCLTDEQGGKIAERYSCNMEANVWLVEPKDLITEKWILNSKYKGKKATLYCSKSAGGAGWTVEKVEFSLQKTENNNVLNPK